MCPINMSIQKSLTLNNTYKSCAALAELYCSHGNSSDGEDQESMEHGKLYPDKESIMFSRC